jgi:hypothetical protein
MLVLSRKPGKKVVIDKGITVTVCEVKDNRVRVAAPSSSATVQRSPDSCWLGDDGLRMAALKLLKSSGFPALRRLRCEVTESVVIVHGVVSSYYLKQMAQAVLQRLDGIQTVRNLVEVRVSELALGRGV